MSDDGKATEEWHAAGLRVGKGGKRAYAWVDAGHHVLTFPQRSGTYSLGAVYEVEVSRDGDNLVMFGSPRFVGPRDPEDKRVLDWRIREVAAEGELEHDRQLRAAKDNDPLDAALAPLLDVASRLRTRVQRRAFTAEVLRRLEAGW